MSLNRVCLIGRLGRDPELRVTVTGLSVAEFSLAVRKRIKPKDGVSDADWFRVKAWGRTAEFVANYLGKGMLVAVDGRLEIRQWTDNEGNNRQSLEVVAEQVQGLDRPRDGQCGDPSGDARQVAPAGGGGDADGYDPFADE